MRLALSKEAIKEIAELLDCGLTCYYNKVTCEIESVPEVPKEGELWVKIFDKTEANFEAFIRFDPPHSNKSFRFMESFILDEVTDRHVQIRLLDAIERKHPFQNFKITLEYYPPLREQWFAYKAGCLERYVQDEMDSYNWQEEEE